MYTPTYRDEVPRRPWGPATSPSPAAAAGRHRTPLDDAPMHDPLMWKDTDNSYISTLDVHLMTYQPPSSSMAADKPAKPPLGKFLSSSWNEAPEEVAAARISKFHTVHDRRPTSIFGSFLQYVSSHFFSRWHEDVRPDDVTALSTKDLINLMQLAMAAGEMDRSAQLARELSRRKLALQMQASPSGAPINGPGGDPANDTQPFAYAPHPEFQRSPQPQPQPVSGYAVFPPLRRSTGQTATAAPWSHSGPAAARREPSWSAPRNEPEAYASTVAEETPRHRATDQTGVWGGASTHHTPLRASALARQGVVNSNQNSDIHLSSVRGSGGGESSWEGSPQSGQWWSATSQRQR